jgi:hypothetical protein
VRKKIISAVKMAEFVSDGMSCIILRGGWCHIVVLNIHTSREDKIDYVNDSFYEELKRVFDTISKYHMKILLGYFIAKVGREDMTDNRGESLQEISNINGVRLVNFATPKNLRVKSTMFPQRKIHKCNWTSPDWKTHNQIDHILVDREGIRIYFMFEHTGSKL